MNATASRTWGLVIGLVAVASCSLAAPFLSEFLYAIPLAGGCAAVVLVVAMLLRLRYPGLARGLFLGALVGALAALLLTMAFISYVVANSA